MISGFGEETNETVKPEIIYILSLVKLLALLVGRGKFYVSSLDWSPKLNTIYKPSWTMT